MEELLTLMTGPLGARAQGPGAVSLWLVYVTAATVLLCLLVVPWLREYILSSNKKKRNLPPGPKGLPLLGHLLFIRKSLHHETCKRWAKEYGPVFR